MAEETWFSSINIKSWKRRIVVFVSRQPNPTIDGTDQLVLIPLCQVVQNPLGMIFQNISKVF